MSDAPLFNGDPCENCSERRLETETAEPYCIASPSGDRDCILISDLAVMEEVAWKIGMQFRRIADRSTRREIVEGTAAGFSAACVLQDRGVTFDEVGFCELAGVPRKVPA